MTNTFHGFKYYFEATFQLEDIVPSEMPPMDAIQFIVEARIITLLSLDEIDSMIQMVRLLGKTLPSRGM